MPSEQQEEPLIAPPVPLDRLLLTPRLDGRAGSNRAPFSAAKQIAADNDLAAIRAWLAEFADSPQTLRAYRKEVERLLLWSILELQKPVSSLTREDLARYEAFLADPQPRERWCGRRTTPRYSPAWRPFEGPLSGASRRQALIILQAFFTYLVHAGYLAGNPLALKRRTRGSAVAKPTTVERFLEQELWNYLLGFVDQMPRETPRQVAHYERTCFLLALLYLLGPRVSEVATHTMDSFVERRGRWWWHVLGKGGKEAYIPVNEEMLQALVRYRTYL